MFNAFPHLAYLGPGGPEFLVIMLVLLVMFGAKDAPRILRKLNEMISHIRNTADGFKREIMYGDLNNETPTHEPATPTDEFGHDEDYDYDGEEDYYNYDEGEEESGEDLFQSLEEDLKEDELTAAADDGTPEDEDGDVPKT